MKGCLVAIGIFFLIILLLVGACTGFAVMKGKESVEKMEAATASLVETNERYPFSAPADGLLEAARYESFLETRAASTEPIHAFHRKIENLEGGDTGFFETIRLAFDMGMGGLELIPQTAAALETGLDAHQMSLDEYVWLTEVTHGTLQVAADQGDPMARTLLEAIDDAQADPEPPTVEAQGSDLPRLRRQLRERFSDYPPQNLALILEHGDALKESTAALILDTFALSRFEVGAEVDLSTEEPADGEMPADPEAPGNEPVDPAGEAVDPPGEGQDGG